MEWSDFGDLAGSLITTYANARIAAEVRPPAPVQARPVYRPGVSTNMPAPYYAAQGGDAGQMFAEIASSPRTWIGLAVVAVLIVVLVKMRR